MSWTKLTTELPKVDKLILLGYKNNIFVMRLKELNELTVLGKTMKHYYLDSALHGGWMSNGNSKTLAIHPDMAWMYPSEFIEDKPEIESNIITIAVED
jgi:hypothetical protein